MTATNTGSTNTSITCTYCSQNHPSALCSTVTDVNSRKEILSKAGRCYIFLWKNHLSRECTSNFSCTKCRGSIMSPFVLTTHLCKAFPLHRDQLGQHQSSLLQYTVVLGHRQTTCMGGCTLQFCCRWHNWNYPILKLPRCPPQWPGRYWMVAARIHISPLEFKISYLYWLWEQSPYKLRLSGLQRATIPHVMLFSLVLPPRLTESFR